MEKAWFGVGMVGLALGGSIWLQMGQLIQMNERVLQLEEKQRAQTLNVPKKGSFKSRRLESDAKEASDVSGQADGSVTPDVGASESAQLVLDQSAQDEMEKVRTERRQERERSMKDRAVALVSELSERFDWTVGQVNEVQSIMEDSFHRRIEIRDSIRNEQIDRADGMDMMQELRDEIEEELERSVGAEGLEAIRSRLPSRGRR